MLIGLIQAGVATAATPATIFGADLVLWFKADVGLFTDVTGVTPVVANNDLIACWTDQVSGLKLVQSGTSSLRPLYKTAGYNGKPCVQLVAANNTGLITASNTFTALNGGTTSSFFGVGQMLTIQNFGRLITASDLNGTSFDFNNPGSYIPILEDGTNSAIEAFFNGSPAGNIAVSTATNYRFGNVRDASALTPYINNVAGTPAATPFTWGTNGSNVAVGGLISDTGGFGTSCWDGPVTELVVARVAATAPQRAALDAYFVNKWGA